MNSTTIEENTSKFAKQPTEYDIMILRTRALGAQQQATQLNPLQVRYYA